MSVCASVLFNFYKMIAHWANLFFHLLIRSFRRHLHPLNAHKLTAGNVYLFVSPDILLPSVHKLGRNTSNIRHRL